MPTIAADEQQAAYKLEDVVISATKMETDISKSPTNVNIITKEDIEKYEARDITDLLKQVPGLKISGLGYGSPSIGSFSTRGSEPDIRGVKIMVNGIDWSKGSGMFSPPRVPVDDIERIEIIKTPSAMFGDQGSGGVINIITRISDKPLEAKAGLGFGSYGAEKYFSVLNGRKNNTEYLIDANLTKTDGYQDNQQGLIRPERSFSILCSSSPMLKMAYRVLVMRTSGIALPDTNEIRQRYTDKRGERELSARFFIDFFAVTDWNRSV